MKKFKVSNDYQAEFAIEFKQDMTKKEVAKLLGCEEEEIQEIDEWTQRWSKIKDLLQEATDTPIAPIMHYTNEMKMAQETPAMQAAIEQWKRQKLTQEQLERLKEIAKEHANPPTHENTDPWTE